MLLFRRLDKYLLGVSVLLVFVGLTMIYSTTFSEGGGNALVIRQSVFAAAGLIFLLVFARLDYHYFQKIALLLYIIAVLSLIGVLFFGLQVGGSSRWFDLGIVRLQPVEFVKLALIIFLAAFFQKRLHQMSRFRNIIISGVITALPVFLTLLQPDLGSALVLVAVWLGLLLSSGVKKRHLAWLLLILVILSLIGWFYFLQDYQKERVFSFLDPTADPKGRGYSAIQSMTAVGSGGVWGRGFGRGVLSQLRFLPERQTDFIFASLAEELGLVGASFLLVLIVIWFFRILKVAQSSRDNFGLFLSLGIFYSLAVQAVINIAMNIGLMPVTGIPLPLVSYGGSSLIISLVSVGVLQSVLIHSQPVRFD